ncbi:DUF3500 domain-containing protein [Pseudonocardia parietis]|uniref:DUF3500 domain-containing protein n=1 Tax=Pseudonocardia parietis TaxID=570936 RepID=A0ABS4VME7_9PSEU|nr:DUF3500 domain-containing protein [Pseudonocardia parietis]MBP2365103.1 hypothetical protein [Pseudonocardia parietis]
MHHRIVFVTKLPGIDHAEFHIGWQMVHAGLLTPTEAEKFRGDKLLDVHFAWAGGVERGQPHYYRIQGPRFLAEYDNTQRDVNHIHSVWRDPEGDFGEDVLAQHRARFHRDG